MNPYQAEQLTRQRGAETAAQAQALTRARTARTARTETRHHDPADRGAIRRHTGWAIVAIGLRIAESGNR
jgi:PIN domain nuclease of toxin-antitoxin system